MEEGSSSVSSFLLRCGSIITGIVSFALGLLYYKQDSLLYFPEIGGVPKRPGSNPRRYRSPSEYNIPYESHMIPTSDGASIHCWLLLHPSSASETRKKPTILFFHGNAGNIGLRLPNAVQMYHKLQANIALVEYRGFGDSSDHIPSEAGLKLDAEAALHFIHSYWIEKLCTSNIYIFGRSLGGAVGFHLAQYAERNNISLSGLMVENTFLSIGKMVDVIMPFVAPFKALILRINWDSESIAPFLNLPVLYLAGAKDQLVPHKQMLALYKKSKAGNKSHPKTHMHVIANGTHNESWLQVRVFFAVNA